MDDYMGRSEGYGMLKNYLEKLGKEYRDKNRFTFDCLCAMGRTLTHYSFFWGQTFHGFTISMDFPILRIVYAGLPTR
jgi:hypothetical protein